MGLRDSCEDWMVALNLSEMRRSAKDRAEACTASDSCIIQVSNIPALPAYVMYEIMSNERPMIVNLDSTSGHRINAYIRLATSAASSTLMVAI